MGLSLYPQTWDQGTYPLLLTTGGHYWRPIQTCTLEDLALQVLVPSGGHKNTYSWQADGTHPTGMFSCFKLLTFQAIMIN